MPSGLMTTGNTSQTRDRTLEKIFFDEYSRYSPMFQEVFKVSSWKERTLKEGQFIGLGGMTETSESHPLDFEVLEQGNTKEISFPAYRLGIQLSRETIDDDIHGITKKITTEMGKSSAYQKDLLAWDVLNTAFVTTYRTGKDGYALCSDTHYLASTDFSTTALDNKSTAALSYTSLEAAKNHYNRMKNEKNIPIYMRPDLLIIPPELEWEAQELLLSEYKPLISNAAAGTATDNTYNYNSAAGMNLKYMVVPFLTSTTAWFLLDSKTADLRFIWRVMPEYKDSIDDNTLNRIMQSYMRCNADFMEWRGTYGSTGT